MEELSALLGTVSFIFEIKLLAMQVCDILQFYLENKLNHNMSKEM